MNNNNNNNSNINIHSPNVSSPNSPNINNDMNVNVNVLFTANEKQIRRAVHLVEDKYLSRSSKVISNSCGAIYGDDNDCIPKLESLHPIPNPNLNISNPPIGQSHSQSDKFILSEKMNDFINQIKSLDNGSAPGPSGWTGNMIKSLITDQECIKLLGTLCTDIINGDLPMECSQYLNSTILVPTEKPNGGIRPIAMGEIIYRLCASLAVKKMIVEVEKILTPIQLGVGFSGGCELIIHDIQHSLNPIHSNQSIGALCVDFKNAFNCINREQLKY